MPLSTTSLGINQPHHHWRLGNHLVYRILFKYANCFRRSLVIVLICSVAAMVGARRSGNVSDEGDFKKLIPFWHAHSSTLLVKNGKMLTITWSLLCVNEDGMWKVGTVELLQRIDYVGSWTIQTQELGILTLLTSPDLNLSHKASWSHCQMLWQDNAVHCCPQTSPIYPQQPSRERGILTQLKVPRFCYCYQLFELFSELVPREIRFRVTWRRSVDWVTWLSSTFVRNVWEKVLSFKEFTKAAIFVQYTALHCWRDILEDWGAVDEERCFGKASKAAVRRAVRIDYHLNAL